MEVFEMVEECNWKEVTQSVSTTRSLVGGLTSTHDEVKIVELNSSNGWNLRSISFHSIF